MSDNWLTVIPTDPSFVPSPETLETTKTLFASFMPDAWKVAASASDRIEFIHPGGNWSGVFCPRCNMDLESFWKDAMDRAFNESAFLNLNIELPCCRITASLNNLRYPWPAGFAKCKIEAMNPNLTGDLRPNQFHCLEQSFGHTLRRIWIHI